MLEFRNVTHAYRRFPRAATTALADFSLVARPGEILGIAGPNGAGKSTLIALTLGFIRPTMGQVLLDGTSPRAFIERHGASYLPELITMNREWKTQEALRRLADLGGLGPAGAQRADELIERLALGEHRGKLIRELSKGTTQRVGIAQALLTNHRLAIFDEPTHGLDPNWVIGFRDLVSEYRAPERLILIASHNLDELERLADRVIILAKGRCEKVIDLRGGVAVGETYRLVVSAGADLVTTTFPGARLIEPGVFDVPDLDNATLSRSLHQFLAAGGEIAEVAPVRSRLEQHFRDAAVA